MKHLNTPQRTYVIHCFAAGLPIPTIVDYFMDMFPHFGAHMGKETRKKRLTERFKKIKQKHADEIRSIENPNHYWYIPMTHRQVRIRHLIRFLDGSLDEKLKEIKKNHDGTIEVKVCKSNCKPNVKDEIAILKLIEKESEHLKNDIPKELYEELQRALTQSLIDHLTPRDNENS